MLEKSTRKLITLGMVVALTVYFAVRSNIFLSWGNISNMLRGASYIGIMTAGLAIVIIGGGNDLSTGAVIGLSCMVLSRLLAAYVATPVAILLTWLVGAGCGLINGYLITRYKMPDFIGTLATMSVFTGATFLVAFRENGSIITKSVTSKAFLALGGNLGGVYYSVLVWIVVALVIHLLMSKTRFGIYTYALGTNATAADLSGVNVSKIKCIGYIICGFCSAVAGSMLLAYQGAAALTTGAGYTFDAICAAVIGGIALTGGTGDVAGATLGCIFMQVLQNGLYKINLSSEWLTIFVGAMIIIMSVVNTVYIRANDRRIQRQRLLADEKEEHPYGYAGS